MQLPPENEIASAVSRAIAEDVGRDDITAALVPQQAHGRARIIAREAAVLCGQAWFSEVFSQLDPQITVEWSRHDGDSLAPNDLVCQLMGPARSLLTGERTALNFLQTLSATATVTRTYVEAIAGTDATILDTRKTIPGLRLAQKYAVTCGGGQNHRIGLFDGMLIKENHIIAAGGIAAAVDQGRRTAPDAMIEVEVENLAQVEEALAAGADRLLLDNFDLEQLKHAVKLRNDAGNLDIKLEASGGVDLQGLQAFARTGVDLISVGALTKHVRAVDFSMRFVET